MCDARYDFNDILTADPVVFNLLSYLDTESLSSFAQTNSTISNFNKFYQISYERKFKYLFPQKYAELKSIGTTNNWKKEYKKKISKVVFFKDESNAQKRCFKKLWLALARLQEYPTEFNLEDFKSIFINELNKAPNKLDFFIHYFIKSQHREISLTEKINNLSNPAIKKKLLSFLYQNFLPHKTQATAIGDDYKLTLDHLYLALACNMDDSIIKNLIEKFHKCLIKKHGYIVNMVDKKSLEIHQNIYSDYSKHYLHLLIAHGKIDLFKNQIKKHPEFLNNECSSLEINLPRTFILYAAKYGRVEIAEYILKSTNKDILTLRVFLEALVHKQDAFIDFLFANNKNLLIDANPEIFLMQLANLKDEELIDEKLIKYCLEKKYIKLNTKFVSYFPDGLELASLDESALTPENLAILAQLRFRKTISNFKSKHKSLLLDTFTPLDLEQISNLNNTDYTYITNTYVLANQVLSSHKNFDFEQLGKLEDKSAWKRTLYNILGILLIIAAVAFIIKTGGTGLIIALPVCALALQLLNIGTVLSLFGISAIFINKGSNPSQHTKRKESTITLFNFFSSFKTTATEKKVEKEIKSQVKA